MKNIGKILGGLAFVILLGLAYLYQNGQLTKLIAGHQQDVTQVAQSPGTIDVGTPTATPVAVVVTPGYKPDPDTLKTILANSLVRVSVENPSKPFYDSEGGLPRGFNVDFAKLLFGDSAFKQNGKSITIDMHHEVATYADVPKQLLAVNADGSHQVDIAMDGLTFPDDTPVGVVYSIPYVDDFGYALIVRSGSPIHSTSDLASKRIGVLKGDPDVRAFVATQYPTATIVEESDEDEAFIQKSVDSGAVDAFIYDYPFAVSAIKNTDLQFAVTKLDGSNISYKIGVRSSDQNLLNYLNGVIAKVKLSSDYLTLLRKYFVSNQATVQAAVSGERSYTVKARDTLNLIASSQLGNSQRYREIQKRNNLPNPNLITVGQTLVIPSK